MELIRSTKKSNTQDFVLKAITIHGNKYDYSKVTYINSKTKVEIICKLEGHGSFFCTPNNHLKIIKSTGFGSACPQCNYDVLSKRRKHSKQNFLNNTPEVNHHGNYDYSLTTYNLINENITVTCTILGHGQFTVRARDHIHDKKGCPKCYKVGSPGQLQLQEFISNLNIDTIRNYKLKDNTEIDILCKDQKIGIEYNGIYFHSEKYVDNKYHLKKTLQAASEGIRLIHIWEDEWVKTPEKVKALLISIFGKSVRIYNARQCIFKEIPWKDAEVFMNTYHLQGACSPTRYCYGLYFEDTLISVMIFTKATQTDNTIELIRFCSEGNIRGGFSKLLSGFIKTNEGLFDKIVSFSENRWSCGNVYIKNGFTFEGNTAPTYYWVKGMNRYHKRNFQHKYLKEKFKNYNENLSESENCHNNGFLKLFDCGKSKWSLEIKKPS